MQAAVHCAFRASSADVIPRPGPFRPGRRRLGARLLAAGLGLLLGLQQPAAAQASATDDPAAPVRFGILPLGGAFESRNDWEPLLADLQRAIGRPVTMLSVTSYEALES